LTKADKEISDTNVIKAVKMLATTIVADEDPMTRKHAIYLISMYRNTDCIPALIHGLRDEEKVVRAQALQALVAIGKPALKDLINLLNDPDWKVRYRAAEALGMIGDEKAVNPLIRILSDNKDHVRYIAAKSLGMLRAQVARDPLCKCLSDENKYVRAMATSSLLKIGN
jgi:HEAT repeat protein